MRVRPTTADLDVRHGPGKSDTDWLAAELDDVQPTETHPLAAPRVVAVVLTHNRPAMLARCLHELHRQSRRPECIVVVDNGSSTPLPDLSAHLPCVRLVTLADNLGPAAGYATGIRAALSEDAAYVWLMDDDGRPEDVDCLSGLLGTAARQASSITCPLVRNVAARERLAFPIRQRGSTRFTVESLDREPVIDGFAHLFNGALIEADAFAKIGVPDCRLFMRGDEVEFLLRARRASLRIVTDTRVGFLHPACDAEVYPILGGAFYAMVPNDAAKRYCQFRNRGWIFWHYGMQGWLLADHVRYACHYLIAARDPAGYLAWLRATWRGVFGRLGAPNADADATAATGKDGAVPKHMRRQASASNRDR